MRSKPKMPPDWTIFDRKAHDITGGWSAKRLEEVTEPEVLDQVAAHNGWARGGESGG